METEKNYIDISSDDILKEIGPKIKTEMNEKLALVAEANKSYNFSVTKIEWLDNGLRLWLNDNKE